MLNKIHVSSLFSLMKKVNKPKGYRGKTLPLEQLPVAKIIHWIISLRWQYSGSRTVP
jgi:hypothetical protein